MMQNHSFNQMFMMNILSAETMPDKTKNSITHWQRRFLTPLGKISVIKSLLLPKITHLLIALPNPDLNILNEINDVLYDFLWNGQKNL